MQGTTTTVLPCVGTVPTAVILYLVVYGARYYLHSNVDIGLLAERYRRLRAFFSLLSCSIVVFRFKFSKGSLSSLPFLSFTMLIFNYLTIFCMARNRRKGGLFNEIKCRLRVYKIVR